MQAYSNNERWLIIRDYSAISTHGALTQRCSDDQHGCNSHDILALLLKRLSGMRKFLLPLLLSACAFVSTSLAQSVPPNIVVILADDLGYGDVSFNGCPDYATPNIDSLATNGIWCSSGYVTHPFCSPSRAALLTGRYQQRFGHENNPGPDEAGDADASNPGLG